MKGKDLSCTGEALWALHRDQLIRQGKKELNSGLLPSQHLSQQPKAMARDTQPFIAIRE